MHTYVCHCQLLCEHANIYIMEIKLSTSQTCLSSHLWENLSQCCSPLIDTKDSEEFSQNAITLNTLTFPYEKLRTHCHRSRVWIRDISVLTVDVAFTLQTWFHSALFSPVLLAGVLFGVVWSITEDECLPGGNLFGITVLFICAVVGGKLVSLIRLPNLPPFPPLLGKAWESSVYALSADVGCLYNPYLHTCLYIFLSVQRFHSVMKMQHINLLNRLM